MFSQKTSIFAAAALAALIQSATALSAPSKRAEAFASPLDGGGTMLTDTGNGLGEPLNVRVDLFASFISFLFFCRFY